MRLLFPLLFLVGCASQAPEAPSEPAATGMEPTTPPGTSPGLTLGTPALTWSEVVSTVGTVRWTATPAATSYVEYDLETLTDTPMRTPSVAGANVAPVLLGLKAGRTYQWRAVSEVDGQRVFESAVQNADVPPPPASLPRFTLTREEIGATTVDGYFITTAPFGDNSWAVILDGQADPVWFHRASPDRMAARIRPALNARTCSGPSVTWRSRPNVARSFEDLWTLHRPRPPASSGATTTTSSTPTTPSAGWPSTSKNTMSKA